MRNQPQTIRKTLCTALVLTLLGGCGTAGRVYDPPTELPGATENPRLSEVVVGQDTVLLQQALMDLVQDADRSGADLAGTPPNEFISIYYEDLESGDILSLYPASYYPCSMVKLVCLAAVYDAIADSEPNEFISIYYEDLESGDILSLYPASYYPCSMVKLVCLAAVYDAIADSELQEEEVSDMLDAMIEISDNTSYNVLAQLAGSDRIQHILEAAGTRNTVVNHGLLPGDAYFGGDPDLPDNTTTAEDMGKILRYIHNWPDEEIRGKMIERLTRCEDDKALVQGLPAEVTVAHKTGWADGLYHDGAIVMEPDGGTYILVVMTENAPMEELSLIAETVTGFRGRKMTGEEPAA